MPHREIPEERIAIERLVLTALCRAFGGAAQQSALRRLEKYQWRDPDHGIIFEALLEIASSRSEAAREQLPTILARRGFPDIEWEQLFKPASCSSAQLESWVHTLMEDSGAGRPQGLSR